MLLIFKDLPAPCRISYDITLIYTGITKGYTALTIYPDVSILYLQFLFTIQSSDEPLQFTQI